MTTLREAAQQALETWHACRRYPDSSNDIAMLDAAFSKLAAALAEQPAQEPVAKGVQGTMKSSHAPQPKAEPQEPVAYIHRHGNHWEVAERHLVDDEKARGWTEEPLYTAPQPRKRLTDQEITLAMMRVEEQGQGYFLRLARAIEAAVWGDGK
jgi:hypothetical protein